MRSARNLDTSQNPSLRTSGKLTRAQLDTLISTWQRRLHLDNFRLYVVVDDEELEDADASCKVHDSYEQATLKFARGWNRWTERYANAVIAHELLHVMENDLALVHERLEDVLDSTSAWKLLDLQYNAEAEALVDRLAWILVELAES